MRILVIGALPRSLVTFRGALIGTMVKQGHTVFAAANGHDENTQNKLEDIGATYISIRIHRTGMNPLADLIACFDLFRLIWRVAPDVMLSYTIKPVIYAGLAAWFNRSIKTYSLITGLGYAFMNTVAIRQRLAAWVSRHLYRLSLRRSQRVFFQNPDDRSAFLAMNLVSPEQSVVVDGSGVDLQHYIYSPSPDPTSGLRFLLIARLLRDKGIREYVAAARYIKRSHPSAEFHLIGSFDSNPTGIKAEEVRSWEEEGLIQFHGRQLDVHPFLQKCHIYVLPSYREGTPRTVLEAMASGRAIITTDAPGCRETICPRDPKPRRPNGPEEESLIKGCNGFLVPIRDASLLASAMEYFFHHPEQIRTMGLESRKYVEERYDVHKVNEAMLHGMEIT